MWITIGSRCCVRDAGTGAWVIAPAAATRMSHPRCRVECAVSEPVRAMLHIRPGAVGEGSAESCGNTPTLNAVEILPCAERPSLHMGARTLKIDIPEITPESCGKPRIGSRERRPRMCSTPAPGSRGTPYRPKSGLHCPGTCAPSCVRAAVRGAERPTPPRTQRGITPTAPIRPHPRPA